VIVKRTVDQGTAMTEAQRSAGIRLVDDKSPILVEVRFPRMGTSPDWHLCETMSEIDAIWERVAPGVELHLHSVWDLKDEVKPLVITR
jgi:hypothetical protein